MTFPNVCRFVVCFLMPVGAVAAQEKQAERYEVRKDHDRYGTGKFYMGREIAQVMSHQGAGWLDRPEREKEEAPSKLLPALKIKPGSAVADVGCGSGYYSMRLAEIVGSKGKVYANDIQEEMLDIVRKKMKDGNVTNIEPIKCTVTDPKLPPGKIDLILMVDVYHEFSHPYEVMKELVKALAPGGRIVFVEFRLEDEKVPILLVHKMSKKQVMKEMEAFPVRHVETLDFLPWQHVIVFEKVADKKTDNYKLGPDSMVQKGVPQGKIIEHKDWKSEVFAGTVRDWWVYVPAQYDPKVPACVMVFQDGGGYKNPTGSYRATVVMDNLIERKEIPVMIGIFVNPGVFPPKEGSKKGESNRSVEYDTLSDKYATFLEKEILPEAAKKYNLRKDAAGRGIGGASSGGICAFTVAWERPDLFSKVLSHVGSFTNIRGGDRYPGIIRKAPKKDIRVFLQDGSNDLDNAAGNWYLANLQMEAALKFKKYDYKTAWGDGGHNGIHGGSILPDSMRYLWADTPQAR